MTKKLLYPLFAVLLLFAIGCEKEEAEETVDVKTTSIIPSTNNGRPNIYLGCIEISSRITTIKVWDHGVIDNDIVSIIANGETIIREKTLPGPNNPISVDYDFGNNGFNYVTLYAHNLGDIPPNTCTISINGREFVLEANLDANGSIDVIVGGYGVDCSDATGGNTGGGTGGNTGGGTGGNTGGGTGGGGSSNKGDVKFWIDRDFGCGPITVDVSGVGTSVITGYFSGGAPDCSNNGGGGNFNDLPAGTYYYTANCQGYSWNSSFTITENQCLKYQLRI